MSARKKAKPVSTHHFADWVELLCVADVDGMMDDSRVRQEARQQKELGEGSQAVESDDEAVKALDKAETNDRWNRIVAEWFVHLRYRAHQFGDAYPFEIANGEDVVTLKSNLSSKQQLYLALLMSSNLRYFGKQQSDLTASFEIICHELFRALSPRTAEVKGMLTAEQGWFFEKQKDGFRRHGYKIQSKLLLATNYGVAQERKRVFIVGVRNDVKDFEYEFPAPTHGEGTRKPFTVLRDVIGGLVAKDDDAICEKEFHGHFLTRNRKRSWDEPSYTIVAHASHVPLHPDGEPMKWVGKDNTSFKAKPTDGFHGGSALRFRDCRNESKWKAACSQNTESSAMPCPRLSVRHS